VSGETDEKTITRKMNKQREKQKKGVFSVRGGNSEQSEQEQKPVKGRENRSDPPRPNEVALSKSGKTRTAITKKKKKNTGHGQKKNQNRR